jgi:hypothetical protein
VQYSGFLVPASKDGNLAERHGCGSHCLQLPEMMSQQAALDCLLLPLVDDAEPFKGPELMTSSQQLVACVFGSPGAATGAVATLVTRVIFRLLDCPGPGASAVCGPLPLAPPRTNRTETRLNDGSELGVGGRAIRACCFFPLRAELQSEKNRFAS